jgi:zinc protease
MKRICKLALMAGCGLVLTGCASLQLPKPSDLRPFRAGETHIQASAPALSRAIKAKKGVWPQAYSDVVADPDVRFGTLSNGMRYALMKNDTPKGQASIRLRFDAGSLMETNAQAGLAHFLEHMAFNGSRNVPEGEMIKILERHGLAFGADTNASTSWTETIYKLDLPKADDETVDISLKLMRETASELLISSDAVERERGVILSEERSRDTPGYQVFKKGIGFFLKGQLASNRIPIGDVEVLKTAPRELIADFYGKYYRPERAVMVITGDFDLDRMEAKIKDRFGDWQASGAAGPEPKLGQPLKRGPEAKVVVQPGASYLVQMSWVKPADHSPDTAIQRQKDIVDMLALAVMNRRLGAMGRGTAPAFVAAGSQYGDLFQSARSATLYVHLKPEEWKSGMAAAYLELRRMVRFGIRQDELDREISSIRADMTAAAAQAKTRRTTALANAIIGTVDEQLVFTNPAQNLALFEQTVKGLNVTQVSAAMGEIFKGSGPLILLSTPFDIVDGEAALLDVLKQVEATPITASAAQDSVIWRHDQFGTPGTVIERQEIADLDAVFVRFANGLRLSVKQTKFSQDGILVSVRMGNGKLDLPKDKASLGWVPGWAFTEGGLSDITSEEVETLFTGKIYSADFGMGDDGVTLGGATRPQDLETQLQLLSAFVQSPGWRTPGVERAKTIYSTVNAQLDSTPKGVLTRSLGHLLADKDQRWQFPSNDQIARLKAEDYRAMIEPDLTKGPIEVVIVGDIPVERAIEAVAATFGAMPARADLITPADAKVVRFPAPTETPLTLTHKGRADQAIGLVAWPTRDFSSNMQESRTLWLLSEVLNLRMTDEFREKQGATYSPWSGSETSEIFPGYGYLSAGVETTPDRLASYYADLDKIAADLRDRPISQDELDRAKKPALEGVDKERQSNGYWLNALTGAQTDGYSLAAIRSKQAQLIKITPADIQNASKAYLTPGKAWRLQVVPEKAQ